ncbi:MAG: SDR family NAD(P)-dependent oxidoreductase [Deltaproteobacteria bacterium]|nr:SDR family NAD(P)-dependent oxidoreductase [Deltaproteobacteria bacterium]
MERFRDVRGRVALVTGAGRGIGRAIALELGRHGARVAVTDLEAQPAEGVAAELTRAGGEGRAYVLDVTRSESVVAIVARVERELGEVDVLINNAGIMALGGFLDQPTSRDAAQLRVNLEGVLNTIRAVLPRMSDRDRGHVVNIASVAGKVGTPHAAVYSATKFAVVGLTEALRAEYDGTGIHFSYVMPALVDTELISGAGRPAWPPVASPEDVARATLDAIRKQQVDVFVPGAVRWLMVLPAILPRVALDFIGRTLKLDRMFAEIDDRARASYHARIDRGTGSEDDEPPGPFGPTPRASA